MAKLAAMLHFVRYFFSELLNQLLLKIVNHYLKIHSLFAKEKLAVL
jgi:hypothetical protein